jgi:hypothetical protein
MVLRAIDGKRRSRSARPFDATPRCSRLPIRPHGPESPLVLHSMPCGSWRVAAQLRNDLWGGKKESDRVQQALDDFRKAIESACKPVVVHEVRSLGI